MPASARALADRRTTVGTIGSGWRGHVTGWGALDPSDGSGRCDWWIGADDRWYVPAEEPSLRQRHVAGTPVVETSMRVPSGDAVQRVYAVADQGGLTIFEVENCSPLPFAAGGVPRRPAGLAPAVAGGPDRRSDRCRRRALPGGPPHDASPGAGPRRSARRRAAVARTALGRAGREGMACLRRPEPDASRCPTKPWWRPSSPPGVRWPWRAGPDPVDDPAGFLLAVAEAGASHAR